jgi:hypothetical protein
MPSKPMRQARRKMVAPSSSVWSLSTMPTRHLPSSLVSRFLRSPSGSERRSSPSSSRPHADVEAEATLLVADTRNGRRLLTAHHHDRSMTKGSRTYVDGRSSVLFPTSKKTNQLPLFLVFPSIIEVNVAI